MEWAQGSAPGRAPDEPSQARRTGRATHGGSGRRQRTPLATLEAFIDGIDDGVVPDDDSSRATMRAQVARLRRLATDVRETAAAEEHALRIVLAGCEATSIAESAVAAARPGYVVVAADEAHVRFLVRDDGVGIPPELDAAFERFHRSDPARARTGGGGSGLGLTIARAIVTDHGGRLTAKSAGPDQGATFTVTLPRGP